MRIAELSQRAGVPVPTIKYYLREGLLPAGTPTGRNQAEYDEHHLGRLRLIRALREVGGLRVTSTQEVLSALDEPETCRHELMGRAHRAVLQRTGDDSARADEAAQWADALGWHVTPGNPALDQLAEVLSALEAVERDDLLTLLPVYADAALSVARREVALAEAAEAPEQVMYSVVTGTVLGEKLLSTLRLLAHEHVSATGSEVTTASEGTTGSEVSGEGPPADR